MIPTGLTRTVSGALTLGLFALLVPNVSLAAQTPTAGGAPIEGTWRTLTGTEIKVTPCGQKYCGSFSYIVVPAKNAHVCRSMSKLDFAALMLDYQNPDKDLQRRQLLGLNALTLTPTDRNGAYDATIYNAEEGKTYNVKMSVKDDTLTLAAGCLGSMCAVTQDWPRVPDRGAPDFSCEGGV